MQLWIAAIGPKLTNFSLTLGSVSLFVDIIHFTQKWYQKWHISAYQAHDHEQPFSHSTGPVPFVGKKENERREGLRPSRKEMVLGMDEWMDGSYITDLNLIRRVFVESETKFWRFPKLLTDGFPSSKGMGMGFLSAFFTLVFTSQGEVFSFPQTCWYKMVITCYHQSCVPWKIRKLKSMVWGFAPSFLMKVLFFAISIKNILKLESIIYYGPIGCSWQRYRKLYRIVWLLHLLCIFRCSVTIHCKWCADWLVTWLAMSKIWIAL